MGFRFCFSFFFYLLLFYTCTPAAAENYINYGTISVFGGVLYVYSIHSSDEIRMTCKTNNNQMLAQPRWNRAQVSLKFKFLRIECGLKAAADACKHKNFQCHNNATRKKLCRCFCWLLFSTQPPVNDIGAHTPCPRTCNMYS